MERRTLFMIVAGVFGGAAFKLNSADARSCPTPVRGLSYEVYREPNGDWRWRLRSQNGNTIADSAEGYRRKENCLAGIKLVKGSYDAPWSIKATADGS
jgi:uncharacterized protein YegP (UPF0339 family)